MRTVESAAITNYLRLQSPGGIVTMMNMSTVNDDDTIDKDIVIIETKAMENNYNNNVNDDDDDDDDDGGGEGDDKSVFWVATFMNLPVPVRMNIFNELDLYSLLEATVVSKQLRKECNDHPGIEN